MAIISPGSISRTNVAPTMSSAAVSLATTQPLVSRPSTSGRNPCGSRAAYSVCSSMKTSENAPRTSGSTAMAAAEQARKLESVDEVAVVAESQAGRRRGPEGGLRVVPDGRSGGRVPAVAHRDVSVQRVQHGLVEDLRHQAHVLVDHDPGPVADGNAGRLLAAMLERVQAVVSKLCDI